MNQDQQEKTGSMPPLEAWMKSASEFWGSMAKMWPGGPGIFGTPAAQKKAGKTRVEESMESSLKMWQTLFSFVNKPGTADAVSQGINALPEIISKMARTGGEAFFRLQNEWLERMARIGQRTEAYKFENLDEDAFGAWTEIYEKEFRKFLNIPQLGLTRFYQERMGRFADKSNQFQGSMARFMHLLYLPMEKSFKVMQEKLEELTGEGKLPEDSQDYYKMWLKTLEGHYMTLFKSPEYTRSLRDTLNTMEEFLTAREKVLEDALQMFPVPTNRDMDDLYKELYYLKKRVKELEKKKN